MISPNKPFSIFINNKRIMFCSEAPVGKNTRTIDLKREPEINLKELFSFYASENSTNEADLAIVSENPEKTIKEFSRHFVLIEAAGGIVKNKHDQLLVIFRRNNWDLPKGKIDEGEQASQAALREVSEECGLTKLAIDSYHDSTYHIYRLDDTSWALKRTYWFRMTSFDSSSPVPQQEEDIEKVLWVDPSFLPVIMEKTYSSLLPVFSQAFDEKL